jgi:micrococcal nuclease
MATNPSYQYRALVIAVIDGDTVDADVELGFYCRSRIRFRLTGIDSAELNSSDPEARAAAVAAKTYLTALIAHREVIIDSKKTEKYGRWLATITCDGQNINAAMIAAGHAEVYTP